MTDDKIIVPRIGIYSEHEIREAYIRDENFKNLGIKLPIPQIHDEGHRHGAVHIDIFEDESHKNIWITIRDILQHVDKKLLQCTAAGHEGDKSSSDLPEAAYDITKRQIFYEFDKLPDNFKLFEMGRWIQNCPGIGERTNLECVISYIGFSKGPFSLEPGKLEKIIKVPTTELIKNVKKEKKLMHENQNYLPKYSFSFLNHVNYLEKYLIKNNLIVPS